MRAVLLAAAAFRHLPAQAQFEIVRRPRTDTVALVEQNAGRPREVPTWLAVIAIVALSLVAGMATYLVRMRSSAPTDPGTTTTASAAYDKSAAAKPRAVCVIWTKRGPC